MLGVFAKELGNISIPSDEMTKEILERFKIYMVVFLYLQVFWCFGL